jgi:hypothetical protein
MSFYSDASLVMIPSGYKDQKVYCAVPTDGAADLTFSRASSATRVASNGLIEKVRTNLLTYSQDFSNAVWVKSAGATLTHSQTDPNGGTTASRLQMPSGTSNFLAASAISGLTNGGKYTHSVYMKSNTGSTQSVRLLDGVRGVAGGSLTASVTTSWQRFDVVITTASTSAGLQIDNNAGTFANDILIAFAQTEESDFGATDYIATTSAAVSVGPVSGLPRLDYLNSTCPRLLLEPQRTNLWINSEAAATWYALDVTATSNTQTSPSGTQSADTITSNTTNDFHGIGSDNIALTSGTKYTGSVFIKAGTGRYVQLLGGGGAFDQNSYANFDLQTGTITVQGSSATANIVNYGNGWYRCEVAATAVNTQNDRFYVAVITTANAARAQSHTTALSYYVWGAQTEAGAYATSYIPTLGTSVTRVADAASKTGISSLIGQTEGTIFFEADVTNSFGIQLGNSTSSNDYLNSIQIAISASSTNAGCHVGGVSQMNFAGAGRTGVQKIALAYKQNDFVLYANGTQLTTDTSASVPAMAAIIYNHVDLGTQNGKVAQTILFPTRLSNSDLAALTA